MRTERTGAEGLWVVIDTNRLASAELRGFLAASAENRAVLPDYVVMERFKPDNVQALQRGFLVLKEYAPQVLVLKGTGAVSQLDPAVGNLAFDMIDRDQTSALQSFAGYLDRAVAGDTAVVSQLQERAKWAQAQMSVVLSGASDFGAGLAEFEAAFTGAQLGRLRRRETVTSEMWANFDGLVADLVRGVRESAPSPLAPMRQETASDHFVYRYALCTAVYMMNLIGRGVSARNPEKARNDAVDVILATYATYFNGVMSEDALTNEVHHIGRFILEQDGVRVAPDYLELIAQGSI